MHFRNPKTRQVGIACLVAVIGLSAACLVLWRQSRRSDINYLPAMSSAEWIVYPLAPDFVLHPRVQMSTVFRKTFALVAPPQQAELQLAGFHQYAFVINGKPPGQPFKTGRTWKSPDHYQVAGLLMPGTNEIVVTVSNTNGPPGLWLALTGDSIRLGSDETWLASYEGAVEQAGISARKPRVIPVGNPRYGGEAAWPSWCASWRTLALFLVLAAAGCGAWRFLNRRSPGRYRAWLPPIFAGVFWLALFAHNVSLIPEAMGFDFNGHRTYIHYIQERHALPMAEEGWEMYQAPLYHLCGAVVLDGLGFSTNDAAGILVLRWFGFVTGLVHLVILWLALRLLFPAESESPTAGLLLAACLPPLIYLSGCVTNEGFAAMLVSAAICLALKLIQGGETSWTGAAGLGVLLGLSMLAKSSALLAVVIILGGLIWHLLVQKQLPWGRVTLLAGVVLSSCLAVCGWRYALVWQRYGNPLIGVWDPKAGTAWWQDTGYGTSAYYQHFGRTLSDPWFNSLNSFFDGLYSTAWGDGQFCGVGDLPARPPWNYELMTVGYWLALVPTLLILAGFAVAIRNLILERATAGWLMMVGLTVLTVFALFQFSFAAPYYSSVKAFYGLLALIPLCGFLILGFRALRGLGRGWGTVLAVLLGFWAVNSYASFWIRNSSEAASLSRAWSMRMLGRHDQAIAVLSARLTMQPHETASRSLLATIYAETGDWPKALEQAGIALQEDPANVMAHLVLAEGLADTGRSPDALAHARRAVELAPGRAGAQEQLAMLCLKHGDFRECVVVARTGLSVAPFNAGLRLALGCALLGNTAGNRSRDDSGEAARQLELAFSLRPGWAGGREMAAATFEKLGRVDEALEQYSQAVRLAPANLNSRRALGALLVRQGRIAEGISQLEAAVQLAPKDAVVQCELAEAYAGASRLDEARSAAQAASEMARATGAAVLDERAQKLLRAIDAPARKSE